MTISPSQFEIGYAHFRDAIQRASGSPFVCFRSGMAAEWEEYKVRLHKRAAALLDISTWHEDAIGKGEILDRVTAAVEINDGSARNNLVRWENRFGHASRSHRALLDARLDLGARRRFDRLFFDLYKGHVDEAVTFEELRSSAGSRYDLLSYLFFLKNVERFMPIAPQTFDQAFSLLGVDLVTTGRCSWENYSRYNRVLRV